MEQLLASSSFQEIYPSGSPYIASHNTSKTSARADLDNPSYCASTFLFAATLTAGEKALLSSVAGVCSCTLSDTTRPEQPDTDTQCGRKRLHAVVKSHPERGEAVHLASAQHSHINSTPPDFYTGQNVSNFIELQKYDVKEPTLGTPKNLPDVFSDTGATGLCAVQRIPFHANLQQAAESKHEDISGGITGDLERDLGIQRCRPARCEICKQTVIGTEIERIELRNQTSRRHS
jgi:hypothetical protein